MIFTIYFIQTKNDFHVSGFYQCPFPNTDLLPECPDPDTDDDGNSDDGNSDDGVPEYETQSDTANVAVDVSIEEMNVGDLVEVYWKGDGVWYEGEVTDVDLGNKQFEIEYFADKQTLTHNDADYKVRMTC